MTNQIDELLEAARGYSDTRILNTLNQAQNYSKQQGEAAKTVAIERGLITKDGYANLTEELNLIKSAKRMLEDNISVDEILANFTSRGIPDDKAQKAIHEASKTADLNRKKAKPEKEGSQWWWWIFIAFFVIRLILRSLKN